jgi:hypothetical protein
VGDISLSEPGDLGLICECAEHLELVHNWAMWATVVCAFPLYSMLPLGTTLGRKWIARNPNMQFGVRQVLDGAMVRVDTLHEQVYVTKSISTFCPVGLKKTSV